MRPYLSNYRSILAHAGGDAASDARVRIAVQLCEFFNARLIGFGTASEAPDAAHEIWLDAEVVNIARSRLRASIDRVGARFRELTQGVAAGTNWTSAGEDATRALVETAHLADLIVLDPTLAGHPVTTPDVSRVLQDGGRPVYFAPAIPFRLRPRTVLLAWNDSRESRRAALDAAPFLNRAAEVVILQVCAEKDVGRVTRRLREVANGLRLCGVPARTEARLLREPTVAREILAAAADFGADLVAAGAYGRQLLPFALTPRKTDELLRRASCPLLLSC